MDPRNNYYENVTFPDGAEGSLRLTLEGFAFLAEGEEASEARKCSWDDVVEYSISSQSAREQKLRLVLRKVSKRTNKEKRKELFLEFQKHKDLVQIEMDITRNLKVLRSTVCVHDYDTEREGSFNIPSLTQRDSRDSTVSIVSESSHHAPFDISFSSATSATTVSGMSESFHSDSMNLKTFHATADDNMRSKMWPSGRLHDSSAALDKSKRRTDFYAEANAARFKEVKVEGAVGSLDTTSNGLAFYKKGSKHFKTKQIPWNVILKLQACKTAPKLKLTLDGDNALLFEFAKQTDMEQVRKEISPHLGLKWNAKKLPSGPLTNIVDAGGDESTTAKQSDGKKRANNPRDTSSPCRTNSPRRNESSRGRVERSQRPVPTEGETVSCPNGKKSTPLVAETEKAPPRGPDTASLVRQTAWRKYEETKEDDVNKPLDLKNHPEMWSITYGQLLDLADGAQKKMGKRQYRKATMRDISRVILEPHCRETRKSYALSLNPKGLLVEAFITHAWDEPFEAFVESIKSCFHTTLVRPTLWICAFALIQGDAQIIEEQIGTGGTLDDSPFVKALANAQVFVVVRNSAVDLYSRIWCICELLYSRKLNLVPNKAFITGPDKFASVESSCLDAQASNPKDRDTILRTLLTEFNREEIDGFVQTFRAYQPPKLHKDGACKMM